MLAGQEGPECFMVITHVIQQPPGQIDSITPLLHKRKWSPESLGISPKSHIWEDAEPGFPPSRRAQSSHSKQANMPLSP